MLRANKIPNERTKNETPDQRPAKTTERHSIKNVTGTGICYRVVGWRSDRDDENHHPTAVAEPNPPLTSLFVPVVSLEMITDTTRCFVEQTKHSNERLGQLVGVGSSVAIQASSVPRSLRAVTKTAKWFRSPRI